MNTKFKVKILLAGLLFWLGAISVASLAVCPMCSVAVGAGVGITQYLGIDDSIAGVWIGGLIASLVLLTKNYLERKDIFQWWLLLVIAALYYGATLLSLQMMGLTGCELNTILGSDKIIVGIVAGTLSFLLGSLSQMFLKSTNGGKNYIAFQKVILPLLWLLLSSTFFYIITS